MNQGVVVSVELPDGSVEELPVDGAASVVIGRDPSCHIVLPSPAVSRQHAIVAFNGSGLRVNDQSANGTFVGDAHVHNQEAVLPEGLAVRIGPYLLRFTPMSARPTEPPKPVAPAAPYQANGLLALAQGTADVPAELRRRLHRLLLDHLDLARIDRAQMDDQVMRPKVKRALDRILTRVSAELPPTVDRDGLIKELTDEALGLGPLEDLLRDDTVTEIMVVDPENIYVERAGKLSLTDLRFTDAESTRAVIERIVTPLGRRIDESTPLVDARLRDGSRVNAIIPPLAIRGPCITIRKFAKRALTVDDLVEFGSVTKRMATFLERCVKIRKNIVISGGTGSGKTTLLNILSRAIPEDERVVTIEDAAELRLNQPHVVSLEARPPNLEGKGEYTIRDLVRNALRMRPDRIVVGECRGGEALDMLQAMNTGHEGSMTTTHANSTREGLKRIETLCLMAGLELPSRAIREQIAASLHLVVQQQRFSDGMRRVSAITEVVELDDNGSFVLHDIFKFYPTGTDASGRVLGEYRATGYLPTFLEEFATAGLVADEVYL